MRSSALFEIGRANLMSANTTEQQDITRVPGRSHYALKYFSGGRIFSYAHQMDTVLSFEPQRVLEIGVGAGVVAAGLRAIGIDVTTVDIQPELEPDLVGSVLDLPLDDHAFDVALCCQVLEHLPFEQFSPALRELRRVVTKGVVLSLPDVRPHYSISWQLPKLGRSSWTGTRPKRASEAKIKSAWESSGHYWEIGYPGVSLSHVHRAIEAAGLSIANEWRVPELAWHHFFRLER